MVIVRKQKAQPASEDVAPSDDEALATSLDINAEASKPAPDEAISIPIVEEQSAATRPVEENESTEIEARGDPESVSEPVLANESDPVEDKEPKSLEAEASPIAPKASESEAPADQQTAATSSLPETKRGAARVVRIIDREKLMERLPYRRGPGGGGRPGQQGPGGAPGRPSDPSRHRFGAVKEVQVVSDPFGRGREMVTVGDRDRRPGAPGAGKGKGRRPAGGGAGVGRPAGRRSTGHGQHRGFQPTRLRRKKGGKSSSMVRNEPTLPKEAKRVVKMNETITVAELARELGIKAVEVIRFLMSLGTMATQNQSIDFDTAQLVCEQFGYRLESVAFSEEAILQEAIAEESSEDLVTRPPVVTIMGHVDHGKTSLLDAIRETRVAAREAGGITQHIGAYSIDLPEKGSITFLDTPGHAAFTSMRARGAQVTDLVVLVVAADDGVMPQTEEAIHHAQAAGVPIVVAINKMDVPAANPERVTQELTKFNLVPESWGGETLYVQTSAVKGTGIDELLETLHLQAEVLELKANPKRDAVGVVIEAKLDKGRGTVATVLVQHGRLSPGDALVVGNYPGRVRAMTDHTGAQVKEAGPSMAVEITGLESVPSAGDKMNKVANADVARDIAEHRAEQRRAEGTDTPTRMSLEEMMKRVKGEEATELAVVLKADVQGSLEAVKQTLLKLSTDEVKLNVIYGGVGGIKESDIMLAGAGGGIVLGFGVSPDSNARRIAVKEGVEIRTYRIIYEMVDDVKKAMEGLLEPESREKIEGRAEVRELFRIGKVGTIAGSRVVEGKAVRSARVRVVRDSAFIYDGTISSLKRFKDDAREVESGLECGIGVDGYNDLKLGDIVEFYTIEKIRRTLDA